MIKGKPQIQIKERCGIPPPFISSRRFHFFRETGEHRFFSGDPFAHGEIGLL